MRKKFTPEQLKKTVSLLKKGYVNTEPNAKFVEELSDRLMNQAVKQNSQKDNNIQTLLTIFMKFSLGLAVLSGY